MYHVILYSFDFIKLRIIKDTYDIDEIIALCRITIYINNTDVEAKKRQNESIKNLKKLMSKSNLIKDMFELK